MLLQVNKKWCQLCHFLPDHYLTTLWCPAIQSPLSLQITTSHILFRKEVIHPIIAWAPNKPWAYSKGNLSHVRLKLNQMSRVFALNHPKYRQNQSLLNWELFILWEKIWGGGTFSLTQNKQREYRDILFQVNRLAIQKESGISETFWKQT